MSAVNSHSMQPFPPQHLIDYNNDFLLNQIKSQVEFYFAPQNLQNDRFLQSQLNATEHLGAVPIQVICSFRKIRQLYSYARGGYYPHEVDMLADPALLRMALVNSSVVSISHDGMWIVPIPQKDSPTEATPPTVASTPSSPSSSQEDLVTERNSIILTDVPTSVSEAMIMDAFRDFAPKTVHMGAGNTWYVGFGTGDDAVAAIAGNVTIEGAPIRGFLKSEAPSVPNMPLPPMASIPNANMMAYPRNFPMPPSPYGLVPMQYPMPPPMPQHSYPVQPQYYPQPQYRYFVPPAQRNSGMPPPQNVFVRPNPANHSIINSNGKGNTNNTNHVQNNTKKRSNNQNKKNRNRQQHAKDQSGSESISRKQNTEASKRHPKYNRGKKRNSPKNLDLGKEHFPVLGGKEKPVLPTNTSSKVDGLAYADALLKSPKSGEQNPRSDTAELEKSMHQMAFSTDAATPSYEEW